MEFTAFNSNGSLAQFKMAADLGVLSEKRNILLFSSNIARVYFSSKFEPERAAKYSLYIIHEVVKS